MKFKSNTPQLTLNYYEAQLKAAGFPCQIVPNYEHIDLVTSEEGEAWLRAAIAANPNPNMTPPKKVLTREEKNLKANKIILSVFAVLLTPFFVLFLITPAKEAPPLSWKEQNLENFGLSSDFAARMTMMVDRNYVKFPHTRKIEDWRVFSVEPDSVTVVYVFSAQNAFGVRMDHSLTVVADANTQQIARLVSYQ